MDIYNSLASQESVLNEQIARQVFDVLPEQGPIMALVNREGHFWPSDSERFSMLNLSEESLRDLCSRIDDGDEPVLTQVNEVSLVASELATDRSNYGYVIVALCESGPEAALANMDLVEIVLGQMSLIAKLIERNNQLYELQMRQSSTYGIDVRASN